MGSWNETCSVTGVPLEAGDDVTLIFITQAKRDLDSITSYVNDCWSPVSIPINCTYDDYGKFRIDDPYEEKMASIAIDHIRSGIEEISAGENEYHDHAVTREGLDWDTLQTAISQGRLFTTRTHYPISEGDEDDFQVKERAPIIAFPILRSIFDIMMTLKGDHFKETGLNGMMKEIDEIITCVKENFQRYEDLDRSEVTESFLISMEHLLFNYGTLDYKLRVDSVYANYETQIGSLFKGLLRKCGDPKTLQFEIDDETYEIFNRVAMIKQLNYALSTLRKSYGPTVGAGGQDANYDDIIRISNATILHCNRQIASWDD